VTNSSVFTYQHTKQNYKNLEHKRQKKKSIHSEMEKKVYVYKTKKGYPILTPIEGERGGLLW